MLYCDAVSLLAKSSKEHAYLKNIGKGDAFIILCHVKIQVV